MRYSLFSEKGEFVKSCEIPDTAEERVVIELNEVSQTLKRIADALERIAPYFEERTICEHFSGKEKE